MISLLKGKKSEINIKCFLDICKTMTYVCGSKYNNVIDTMKEQLNDKESKNGLYIENYGLFPMLSVLYNCAKGKTFKKEELQKIYRAILRFEVYKIIRARIRKAEKKEDYIKESLNAALGIDFEKYGTKLPELFQKKVDPKFYDQFHINEKVVKEYFKSVGWTDIIPLSYILFSASLEPNSNPIDNIKQIKEYSFKDLQEEFGINYDFNKFIMFNIVQSLIYKEKIDRDNETKKVMKIIDSNNEEEVDKFLKDQVKHIYSAEYTKENQKQIKKQFEIISTELTDKLISSKELSEFNLLMKNGITKGYLTHKISNDSSKGYIELKKKILDEKVDVPLRYEKLKAIISGKDEQGNDLWNNGNAIRTHRKDYQVFIQKNKPEIWEEIAKANLEHKYREKINRQGHSNTKKSYWALGFDTLQDFYELCKEKDVKEYKKLHNNCCGLGDQKKSLKNLKKIEHKKKRKEFRQKKKESDNKEDKKQEDKKINDMNSEENKDEKEFRRPRGRHRGYRGYRGRKRLRGGRKPKVETDIKPMKKDYSEEEYSGERSYSDDEEIENPIVGRKKKRAEKNKKKKEKMDKKMDRKLNKLKDSKKK